MRTIKIINREIKRLLYMYKPRTVSRVKESTFVRTLLVACWGKVQGKKVPAEQGDHRWGGVDLDDASQRYPGAQALTIRGTVVRSHSPSESTIGSSSPAPG